MEPKVWCEHCNKYTDQGSAGCIECGKVTLNYRDSTRTVNTSTNIEQPKTTGGYN